MYQSFGWVHATDGDLLQARFWLPPDEETAFDDDSEVPADARALGLSTYLEPATFADVLEVQKRQRPLSTLAEYAQALVHYHEYDAFQEVEGIDEALGEATAADRAAAQRVAQLHEVPVGEALARCRALPLLLGQALDRNRAQAIKDEFEAIGAPVQVQGFKAFPWMDAPTLR